MNLYEEVRQFAPSDREANVFLSAIHHTLDHFNIQHDRDKVASALLKFHVLRQTGVLLDHDDPKIGKMIALDEQLSRELSQASKLAAS
jgi:hypothetical protein